MSKRSVNAVYGLVLVFLMLVIVIPAQAYVTPRIGGAQRMHTEAPMIMPEITFNGTNVVVLDDMGNDWETLTGNDRPVMWPLQSDSFDPAQPWYNALNGKSYNWQYGWSNAAFSQSSLPADCNIWIEVTSQSVGLNAYDRTANSYAPIFGTDGSSVRWKWNDDISMSHNAYTVTPVYGEWSATYKLYIGNATSGAEIAGFGSDTVTLTWTSVPEPASMALLALGTVCLLRKKRA